MESPKPNLLPTANILIELLATLFSLIVFCVVVGDVIVSELKAAIPSLCNSMNVEAKVEGDE